MFLSSFEHFDEQIVAIPTNFAHTTSCMVFLSSPPDGKMTPSSLSQPNAQYNDNEFKVQPSQDRTCIALNYDMDWVKLPSHNVVTRLEITCLVSGSSQPVTSNDLVIGQSHALVATQRTYRCCVPLYKTY